MKRIIIILMFSIMFFCAFAVNVSAEENFLKAPAVQFKLINHDKIALKWDDVDGADSYLIYRTDVKTGKKYKYPNPVSGSKVTIGKLSSETEYIFTVAPIKKNGDDFIIGEKSSGTMITTPKEWYCYSDYELDNENEKIHSHYYREDYAKTKKEEFFTDKIKSADEIFYINGWYYFICDYDAVCLQDYPFTRNSFYKCIGKIKEDGSEIKIIIDDLIDDSYHTFKYIFSDEAIYLYNSGYEEAEFSEDAMMLEYVPEDCRLMKIPYETDEVIIINNTCLISELFYSGNLYYLRYMLNYDEKRNVYYNGPVSFDYRLIGEKSELFLYNVDSADLNSRKKIKINDEGLSGCTVSSDSENTYLILCYSDVYYIYNITSVPYIIYKGKGIVKSFDAINDYLYLSIIDNKTKDDIFVRMKGNGSDLTKEDKPFEWYY